MTRGRAETSAWVIGGIGLFASVVGWIVAPRLFPHAWLAALVCWLAWPLGSMGLLLIHSITGGRWGHAIRPQLVLGITTLPLALPASLPLLVELQALYPWARPEVARELGNTSYLNVPFAVARGVLYLVIWLGLGALMLRAVRRNDDDASLYRLAPFGLILLALTVTFGGFDATMSLDPHYNSSIYGMILIAEAGLFACSVATLLALLVSPLPRRTTADLGRLMLGLLVFWGYLVFMELLIVWNSDLGSDAPWYVLRVQHGWGIVAGIVAVFHFAVPFLLLIWPQVQGSRGAMLVVSGTLVAAEVPHAWWLVVPAAGRSLSWVDVCAMVAMAGLSFGFGLWARRQPMVLQGVRQHG